MERNELKYNVFGFEIMEYKIPFNFDHKTKIW